MRKIEQDMCVAVENQSNWCSGNTSVQRIDDVNMAVYLHGNHLADVNSRSGFVMLNMHTYITWSTNTTRSRINALTKYFKRSHEHS
jgi:hypothetical protein